jgi:hypothetical protein
MDINDIDFTWYEFTALADWVSLLRDVTIVKGQRGYVRRNDKQENYFQVIVSNNGFIEANYMSRRDTARIISPTKQTQNQARVDDMWHDVWKTKYQK